MADFTDVMQNEGVPADMSLDELVESFSGVLGEEGALSQPERAFLTETEEELRSRDLGDPATQLMLGLYDGQGTVDGTDHAWQEVREAGIRGQDGRLHTLFDDGGSFDLSGLTSFLLEDVGIPTGAEVTGVGERYEAVGTDDFIQNHRTLLGENRPGEFVRVGGALGYIAPETQIVSLYKPDDIGVSDETFNGIENKLRIAEVLDAYGGNVIDYSGQFHKIDQLDPSFIGGELELDSTGRLAGQNLESALPRGVGGIYEQAHGQSTDSPFTAITTPEGAYFERVVVPTDISVKFGSYTGPLGDVYEDDALKFYGRFPTMSIDATFYLHLGGVNGSALGVNPSSEDDNGGSSGGGSGGGSSGGGDDGGSNGGNDSGSGGGTGSL